MRNLLKFIFLCAVALFALNAVEHSFSSTSSKQTAPASSTPPPAMAQSSPEQLARAAKCERALKQDKSGIWRRYESRGSILTVEVGPSFYFSDYNTKSALNSLMVCVATEGRMDKSIDYADYLDWSTHKTVAEWTPGLGLEVK